ARRASAGPSLGGSGGRQPRPESCHGSRRCFFFLIRWRVERDQNVANAVSEPDVRLSCEVIDNKLFAAPENAISKAYVVYIWKTSERFAHEHIQILILLIFHVVDLLEIVKEI